MYIRFNDERGDDRCSHSDYDDLSPYQALLEGLDPWRHHRRCRNSNCDHVEDMGERSFLEIVGDTEYLRDLVMKYILSFIAISFVSGLIYAIYMLSQR